VLHSAPAKIGFIPPLLPTLVNDVPEGDDWQHEIKHDGYRSQIVINQDRARAFSRNGHDYSAQFQTIVDAARRLGCTSAIVDGETVVQDQQGRSDFHALRSAIHSQQHRLIFYAFDLLHLNGQDLRRVSLRERRAALADLIGEHDPAWPIQFSEAIVGNGAAVLAQACARELEGIVSKKLDSRYRSGRSASWLKVKCYDEGEFVVLGAEHEPGKPAFALLAREIDGSLDYAGSAFVTLGGEQRDRFWSEIERLARPRAPLKIVGHKKARWARPEMRVQVQHLKGSGMLRHATVREIVT